MPQLPSWTGPGRAVDDAWAGSGKLVFPGRNSSYDCVERNGERFPAMSAQQVFAPARKQRRG